MLPTLEETREASVIIATSGTLAFRHELVRTAVYDGMPESIRLGLHRQIGGMLLDRGGSAVAAAGHLGIGASRGDHQVLAALDGAIPELVRSSPESAASVAVRALELTEPSDDDRFTRTTTAVETLV